VFFRGRLSCFRYYSNNTNGNRHDQCNAKTPSHSRRLAANLELRESAFVIRASDLIRHSTLVIRHFPPLNFQPSTLN
jgi:hypothetical protein